MSYDVSAVRSHFPALAEGAAHFDGPGGSQVPDVVGSAVSTALTAAVANRGQVTVAERRAEQLVTDFRAALADLLGSEPDGIVHGRSMTALTFDLARAFAKTWGPGDEVVVSRLDHDANVRPWVIAAERAGATVRWLDFDPATGELTPDHLAAVLGPRTRLVAVTAGSNLIGTRPDVPALAEATHAVGALLYLDAVHAAAHIPLDRRALGADVLVCSPYKFMGPHCGVLAGDPGLLAGLQPDKLLPSSDRVPERFELGTLPYEVLAGCTAAVDFIAGLGDLTGAAPSRPGASRRERIVGAMTAVEEYEDGLRVRIEAALADLPGLTVHSRAARRTPTLLVTSDRVEAGALSAALAQAGVNAPAGSFYAIGPSQRLGLGVAGGLRIGLAPYSSEADVTRLLEGLSRTLAGAAR